MSEGGQRTGGKPTGGKPTTGKPTTGKPTTGKPTGGERTGGQWPMAERSLLATVLGVPPLGAMGVAASFTLLGVAIDLAWIGTLGTVFTIFFVAGSVLAVAWVRRSGLFGPMVQPPLLVAVAVPVVVLLSGAPKPGAGIAERALVVGAPLVNAFPVMATATVLVLALGGFRLLVQRPVPPTKREPVVSERQKPAADEARGAGRTPTSPPRS